MGMDGQVKKAYWFRNWKRVEMGTAASQNEREGRKEKNEKNQRIGNKGR
jgi:hypothetical protein